MASVPHTFACCLRLRRSTSSRIAVALLWSIGDPSLSRGISSLHPKERKQLQCTEQQGYCIPTETKGCQIGRHASLHRDLAFVRHQTQWPAFDKRRLSRQQF